MDLPFSFPDVYLCNLAALSGEVGAIDEPLGGYRSHGRNDSTIVKKENWTNQLSGDSRNGKSVTLPLYKRPIIAGWSFMVMLLPKAFAQPLIAIGYHLGLVRAATRARTI
jgi:hypothetical protein